MCKCVIDKNYKIIFKNKTLTARNKLEYMRYAEGMLSHRSRNSMPFTCKIGRSSNRYTLSHVHPDAVFKQGKAAIGL